MTSGAASAGNAPSTARLMIHADPSARPWPGLPDGAARRLAAWVAAAMRGSRPVAAEVRIFDLQGRTVFAATALGTLVDVPLPAGTYHVMVQALGAQRRYTVTLPNDATVHLQIRLAIGLARDPPDPAGSG